MMPAVDGDELERGESPEESSSDRGRAVLHYEGVRELESVERTVLRSVERGPLGFARRRETYRLRRWLDVRTGRIFVEIPDGSQQPIRVEDVDAVDIFKPRR